jgi:Glycosyltransferase family 92
VKKRERTGRFFRQLLKSDALALRFVLFRTAVRDLLVRVSRHHRLTVCAIFREEAPFLEEWLTFHSAVGVGHFYLYNNFSTDGYLAVLKPWIDRGLVTLYDWPHETGQLAAYRHCVQNHWRNAWWIAFIDLDEFLFSPASRNLVPILDRYTDVPALVVYSIFYGSSGHQSRVTAPVTMSYRWRARIEVASSGKTIANPRRIRAIENCHIFLYWKVAEVDTNRRALREDRDENNVPLDLCRINHYWSRSISDLRDKVGRGDASTAEGRNLEAHLVYEKKLNSTEDNSILALASSIFGKTVTTECS